MEPSPLTKIIKNLAGIRQTQQQTFLELRKEQEQRFKAPLGSDRGLTGALELGPVSRYSSRSYDLHQKGAQDNPESVC